MQVYQTKSWVPTKEGWAKIGVSGLTGAMSSGISALSKLGAMGKVASIAGNTMIGGMDGIAKNAIDGKDVAENLPENMALSFGGEVIGVAGQTFAQGTSKGKELLHNAKRAENIANNGRQRISQTLKAAKAKNISNNYGAGNIANTIKSSIQAVVGNIGNSNNNTQIPLRPENNKRKQ